MALVSAKELWSQVSRACSRAAQGLGNSHVTRTTLQITCQGQVALTDALTGTWPDYVQQLFRTTHVNEREVRLMVAALIDHVLNDHRARHVTDIIAGFHLANQIAQSILPNLATLWEHAAIDRHSLLTAALNWTRDTSDRCQIEDWIQQLALNTFRSAYQPRLPFMKRVRFVEGVGKSSRDSAVLSGLLIEQPPSVTVPSDALVHESRVVVVSASLHGGRTKTRVTQSVAVESDLSRAQQLVAWLSRAGPRVILCAQWDIPSEVLALIRLHNFTERHVNQRPHWILVWSYVPGDLLEDIALYSNCHIVTHIDLEHNLALPFIGNVEQVFEYPLGPNRALYWLSSPSRAASLTSVVIRGASPALRQHVKQQLMSHLSRLEHVLVSRANTALIDGTPEKKLDELLQSYCYQSRDTNVLAHASDIRAWSRALLNLVPELDDTPHHVTVAEKVDTYTRATELACQILKIDQGILYDQS